MKNPSTAALPDLAGRTVLVGVCGGIAAYKCAGVVSALRQAGADVHVIMTEAAQRFVTPLTFQALSNNVVHTQMLEAQATQDNLRALQDRGFSFIEPGAGFLACGEIGQGRLADEAEILAAGAHVVR